MYPQKPSSSRGREHALLKTFQASGALDSPPPPPKLNCAVAAPKQELAATVVPEEFQCGTEAKILMAELNRGESKEYAQAIQRAAKHAPGNTTCLARVTGEQSLVHAAQVVMWSFPGSGSTWARLLVESATGWCTASVYTNDKALQRVMACEKQDGKKVKRSQFPVFTKAHSWTKMRQGGPWLGKTFGKQVPLVILVRDPLHAMWAEFVHIRTGGDSLNHDGHIPKDHFIGIFKDWLGIVDMFCKDVVKMWKDQYRLQVERGSSIHWLKFENLANPATRDETLAALVSFLVHNVDSTRLACAFKNGDRNWAHRSHDKLDPTIATFEMATGDPSLTGMPENAKPMGNLCKTYASYFYEMQEVAIGIGFMWDYTLPEWCQS